jgi:hypothetical protein
VKETVDQVLMVKEFSPKPKDVIKAAANLAGEAVTYNQGYQGIKNINNIILKMMKNRFNTSSHTYHTFRNPIQMRRFIIKR